MLRLYCFKLAWLGLFLTIFGCSQAPSSPPGNPGSPTVQASVPAVPATPTVPDTPGAPQTPVGVWKSTSGGYIEFQDDGDMVQFHDSGRESLRARWRLQSDGRLEVVWSSGRTAEYKWTLQEGNPKKMTISWENSTETFTPGTLPLP